MNMQLQLTGKTALITGSSQGIGLEIAKLLHSEGCRVALNGRNTYMLNSASNELNGSIAVAGDVTLPQEASRIVLEVLAAFGKLDILVCNVGSGRSVSPGNECPQEWQKIFALNFWSVTNVVEAAIESLTISKGVIICISSICGIEAIPEAPVTYSSAKAALNAYVRGIARPLGKKGIRINAIAPGNIVFNGSVWSKKLEDDELSVHSFLNRDVCLGNLGHPSDVAHLVAFLASPLSKFATGGVWTLDGGQIRS